MKLPNSKRIILYMFLSLVATLSYKAFMMTFPSITHKAYHIEYELIPRIEIIITVFLLFLFLMVVGNVTSSYYNLPKSELIRIEIEINLFLWIVIVSLLVFTEYGKLKEYLLISPYLFGAILIISWANAIYTVIERKKRKKEIQKNQYL